MDESFRIESVRKLSHKELRNKANQSLAALESSAPQERDLLSYKADIYVRELDRRRDYWSWVSTRDLILEIIVIGLIGWEIIMGYQQEKMQSKNFADQQVVLKNLKDTSKDTADTLASLKSTTETMNQSVQRSAIATEANAATTAQTLHLSERAYLSCVVSMPVPIKAGDKLHLMVTMINAGKGLATDVVQVSGVTIALKSTTAEAAQVLALAIANKFPSPSKAPLAAGQQFQQVLDSSSPLTEDDVKNIEDQRVVVYTFVDVKYRDLFGRNHRLESCTFYYPPTKQMANCAALNKAD